MLGYVGVQLDKGSKSIFDINRVRKDFPVLNQKVNGKDLVYLDNAATTQKPKVVIDSLIEYYSSYNANIHRGNHSLAEKATAAFEATRTSVQNLINASSMEEVIFTSGATHSINLVASSYGRKNLQKGDIILISAMEHHSNMVPWQMLAEEKEALLKIIPIDDSGDIILEEFQKLLNNKVKIVAVNHASNTLGTVNPISAIIKLAHETGSVVLIDGSQAVAHLDINVQELNVDFYAFSSHKMYGPTGVGILYGKKELLQNMPPYQGGGEMIKDVSYEKCTYNELPYKFEAGTPNIADVIAFGNATNYLQQYDRISLQNHENYLLKYATESLKDIKGLRIVGEAKEKISVISFVLEGIHHQDIGILLDQDSIAVRTGNHCTQPLMARLNILGTSRASFAMYNTVEEIDKLVMGINKVIKMFR